MEKKMICKCEENKEEKCTLYGHKPGCKGYYDKNCDIYNIDNIEESFSGLSKSTGKYRVTRGIFEGHVFNGHEITISGEKRIWDDDSVGNSYPIENTEIVNSGFSGRIVNEDLAKSSPCHKVERISYFKKGVAGSLNKEQVKNYCFEKE